MASAAPETEIGHGNTGLIPWSAFADVTEQVAELAWPNSITTYSAMRTDAQIASLLLPFSLPIRRYGWYIDPNGARDEVPTDLQSSTASVNVVRAAERPQLCGKADSAETRYGGAVDVKRAADLYAQGRTLRQIGAELGISSTTVSEQLRRAGVIMRRGGPSSHPASTQWILVLRDQGLTWNEVAKQVDMTVSGAWSR